MNLETIGNTTKYEPATKKEVLEKFDELFNEETEFSDNIAVGHTLTYKDERFGVKRFISIAIDKILANYDFPPQEGSQAFNKARKKMNKITGKIQEGSSLA